MDYKELADLMFPDIVETPEYYENVFPNRNLEEGAIVGRIGPSPTGFVHLGNLYNAIVCERMIRQSNGVFILRIEDTDKKREVSGAVEMLIDYMGYYGIAFDEGVTLNGEIGDYGPYKQRQRKQIYQAFAKDLVRKGLAYPCFCTEERLNQIREAQRQNKVNIGYYGEWAIDRDLPMEEVKQLLEKKIPFVTRFKSDGNASRMVKFVDGIKGNIEIQENYLDVILLKSDGIPTYHFAHVIDDHLMRTTHVVRGEEWLPSTPIHLQLFDALGFEPPQYIHTAQLMKMDGTSKRKLSKRKDPELALAYYKQEGYPTDAVWKYFLTILNSDFEEWDTKNVGKDYKEFPFAISKMNNSGVLFDLPKLGNISKDVIAQKSAEFIYKELCDWANVYDKQFADLLSTNQEYAIAAISVGRKPNKCRKDFATWKEASQFLAFYYDELFEIKEKFSDYLESEMCLSILKNYLKIAEVEQDSTTWFERVKELTESLGFATQTKVYKKNPEVYKGSIVDVTNIIRIALMGKANAPDIWEVSQVLGKNRVIKRINQAIDLINS